MKRSLPDDNPKTRFGVTKPDLALVPPASLIYEALAFMDGAKKYAPYNWRAKRVSSMIYISAAMRHISQYLDGEDIDPKSKVPHLAHAKACLGILIDATVTGNLNDNRPPKGAASKLIEEWTMAMQQSAPPVIAPPPVRRRVMA